MGFEKVYKNYACEALLVDGTMFWPARRKKKAGGMGGAQPPAICKHNVFITGSERVHIGSVIAGRMILEAFLHRLKSTGVGGT